jgi:hypothetical protein
LLEESCAVFEILLILAGLVALGGAVIAFDGCRDVFHPLVFIGPMFAFLYCWMPFQLVQHGALAQFFDDDQLRFVQTLNVLGVTAFVVGCLGAGVRIRKTRFAQRKLSAPAAKKLLIGAAVIGSLGLSCWLITIHNVGGIRQAFSTSYAGGWDDNGYVRDGSLLLLVGVMLAVTALTAGGPRLASLSVACLFALPWATSALFMGRRGPTFALVVVVMMSWYFNRGKRPPLLTFGLGGVALGWLVLFLVTNRQNLYIGSDFHMKTDVSRMVDKADTGNEFIYGSGTVLATERRDHYFWMRRYLAQIVVRPIPSAIWPTKYEDFGVPELLHNAGTGEGFADALGWRGAPGSAPGIVADLWVELWWLAVAAMGVLGWTYGRVWHKAVTRGGVWTCQYIVLSALSIYLVMQTMEAVIFRTLLLSVPCWIAYRVVEKRARSRSRRRLFMPRAEVYARRAQARRLRAVNALPEARHA